MTNDTWTGRTRCVVGALGILVSSVFLSAGRASAQDRTTADDEWCAGHDRRDGESVCEVREWTLGAPEALSVNARPNGGISVEAWDRGEMLVRAKVHAWADSNGRARELTERIEPGVGASISVDGPKIRADEGWSVSFRIMVPRDTDLDLASTNGGITIEGIRGKLRFQTTNGGIRIEDIGGDVEGKTTNGGVQVVLTGDRWDGKGMEVRTMNGGVKMSIPAGYSAHLETATVNGGLSIGFPVTVQGKLDRTLSVDLGGGGATIKATTTNGGVRISEG